MDHKPITWFQMYLTITRYANSGNHPAPGAISPGGEVTAD
ncbi:hypothetical protein MLGJGCBP_03023 [Rhodococcus sp. T7]|nr:hypothetical protein MLGJGCBP_03023 [Rhodococcus sp. T7]